MKEPTATEKIAGSMPAKALVTGLAVFDGGILAALLPVLADAIPARRHEKRVREALEQVEMIIKIHTAKINNLSDSQYKLINNAAMTILSTVQDQKIDYLKRVIENSFVNDDVHLFETEIVSRWMRDMSAEELEFILRNYAHRRVAISVSGGYDDCLMLDPESRESTIAAGLISLGILVPSGPNIDTLGTYTFSNLTAKLIALLSE